MAQRSKPKKTYQKHKAPRRPPAGGLYALKRAHGSSLGVTCLHCLVKLKNKSEGRRRVICAKEKCFRAYRAAYHTDLYAMQKAAAK